MQLGEGAIAGDEGWNQQASDRLLAGPLTYKRLRSFLPEGDAARPLRSLLGETEAPASAEEIAWGFRKLLEREAQEHLLVVLFDDLHWAEETLLDLVEHVADLSRDAPLLLLCMARPEFLERRPSWGGGKWNATTVLLEPLDGAETERLLADLGDLPEDLHERIVQVAEGNPLFLEEMFALVRDSGDAAVEVPPTIQALLSARMMSDRRFALRQATAPTRAPSAFKWRRLATYLLPAALRHW